MKMIIVFYQWLVRHSVCHGHLAVGSGSRWQIQERAQGARLRAMGKMRNCGMCNVEGKTRSGKCGMTVIGPQVRSRDHSCYAVYRTLRVAGAVVNCVMQVWKVAFYACYRNLNLSFAAMCV